jgi:hypothetical protein
LNPSRNASIQNLLATPETISDILTSNSMAIIDSTMPTIQHTAGTFDMEDMELWHHFITSTADTLSSPWCDELPRIALSCDYLLHAILATAALHHAFLDPSQAERYNYRAQHHQVLGLPSSKRAMSEITSENASQLFAFSNLLMIFNFASYRSPEQVFPFASDGGYHGVSNWIACLRGCSSLISMAGTHIEAGPLGFLLTQGRELAFSIANGALPRPEDDESLKQITETVLHLPSIKSSTTVEEMESYIDAISCLRNLLAASAQGLTSIMQRVTTSMWPCQVKDTYVRLLSEYRPPALIIMAHYCILLKDVKDCWYMEHRALNLFEAVQKGLGEEWAPYVEHPYHVVTERS